VLYKCFSNSEYASAFLRGQVRFGSLSFYRRIEDPGRGDADEGYGRAREWRDDRTAVVTQGSNAREVNSPGEVVRHSELGNPVFICCFTEPREEDWSKIKREFGSYVVQIDDQDRLCQDIHAALDHSCEWQKNAATVMWSVTYDKDQLVSDKDFDPVRRSVAQKSGKYSYQAESRVVLISYSMQKSIPESVTVNIGRQLEYARLL